MKSKCLYRTVPFLLFLAAALTAQVARQSDAVPLKHWTAPQYWQPTRVDNQAAAVQPDAVGSLDTASTANALVFVGITPCRIVDTRAATGFTGAFGPPSLARNSTRTFPIQSSTACVIPPIAQAYSFNVTVVPQGSLGFLTVYPTGQSRPLVSTLNSIQGFVVANAAVVPAGTAGSVDVFAPDATDLVLDINGYYAPASGITLTQGTAAAPALTFSGDTGTGIFSSGNGSLDLTAGGTNGLRLESSGQVTVASGINTNGPISMLFDPILPESLKSGQTAGVDAITGSPVKNAILVGANSCTVGASFGRAWMKNGSFMCWETDLMYVGLKDEGSDRKDSVVAWGDNSTSDAGSGPDNLRFIFAGRTSLGGVQGSLNGLEAARFTPEGAFGLGTPSPTNLLDVNGTARVRTLPPANAQLVTATANGVLGSIAFPTPLDPNKVLLGNGTFGTVSGGGNVSGSCASNNIVTKWSGGNVSCSEITDTGSFPGGRIGIDNSNPQAKLDVNGDVNAGDNPVKFHYQIANSTVLSIDGTHNVLIGVGPSSAGQDSTIIGALAGIANTGSDNTFSGYEAGTSNITGGQNTFLGAFAGIKNLTGSGDTFVGYGTANNLTSGSNNLFLGNAAGNNNVSGDSDIYIGNSGCPVSVCVESSTIRIGTDGTQTKTFIAGIAGVTVANSVSVLIDPATGQLGTVNSSRRFKQDIEDMAQASSGLLRLRPVTYRYKEPYADGSKPIDYGLIAEEVAEVYPDLVAKDAEGQVQTVQYHKLVPMLLNEVQKQAEAIQLQQEQNRNLEARIRALETLLSGKVSTASSRQ